MSNSTDTFLPISSEDMKKRGWEQCDFVFVSGSCLTATTLSFNGFIAIIISFFSILAQKLALSRLEC